MLALRLQRTGRKGYALYRLVAQDAHRSPMSGKVAAYLGSYDPHAKTLTVDREKVEFYLEHGAQPSSRVIVLLEKEGLKLPDWVRRAPTKKRSIKKPEKLRRNRPPEPAAPAGEATTEEIDTPEVKETPSEGTETVADAVQQPETEVAEAVTVELAPEAEAAPEKEEPKAAESDAPTDEAEANTAADEKPKKAKAVTEQKPDETPAS